MYESFDHMRVKVVQITTIVGPYTKIDEDSATYSRVLTEAKAILEKLSRGSDKLWDYFEIIGINPQDSFTADLEDKILEYLLRVALIPYKIDFVAFVSKDNGMADLDEVTFFIK